MTAYAFSMRERCLGLEREQTCMTVISAGADGAVGGPRVDPFSKDSPIKAMGIEHFPVRSRPCRVVALWPDA